MRNRNAKSQESQKLLRNENAKTCIEFQPEKQLSKNENTSLSLVSCQSKFPTLQAEDCCTKANIISFSCNSYT